MLCLREIGSRPKSYINMILRQVSFPTLTVYFLARQMSDVSTGPIGRGWLTVVFFLFFFSSSQCYKYQKGSFADWTAMKGEMLRDGERFSD